MTVLDERARGARRFEGQSAVVTGAGQGIGRATARRLAQEGARVVIVDRNEDGARRVLGELQGIGADARTFLTDMGSAEAVKALLQFAIDEFGHIDVLVNTVGGSIWSKPAWEFTEQELEETVRNNFWTTMWACWAVLPHMIERGTGAIVNLGSNCHRARCVTPTQHPKAACSR